MKFFRGSSHPVSRRKRRKPGEVAALVLIVLSVTTPVLLSLWQRGELLRYGYEIENLKQERDELAEQKRKLIVERSSRQSLAIVEETARRDLGLIEPPNSHIVIVSEQVATR